MAKPNLTPNLFDYATGELSQDAFICWLLQWSGCKEATDMNNAAKTFVALLYNLAKNTSITKDDIGEINKKEIKQQYHRTDIFFTAQIDKIKTNFIIEDKTETSPHSDQLKRYLGEIKKSKFGSNPTIGILYKTGYIYPDDRKKCKKADFYILDCHKIRCFLRSVETDNTIFNDYKDFIENKVTERDTALRALNTPSGEVIKNNLKLKLACCQFEFIEQLQDLCPETIGREKDENKIGTGNNIGGIPWTQYLFAKVKGDGLRYRVERRRFEGENEYCLSLRQYSTPKNPTEKEEKKIRLKSIIGYFKSAKKSYLDSAKETANCKIEFSKPGKDNKGKKSSEISLIRFDETKNSITNIKSELPKLHKIFIEFLKKYEVTEI